jgi:hypothetical protein
MPSRGRLVSFFVVFRSSAMGFGGEFVLLGRVSV